jgi:2-methylcitrate dehydratase PrpD
MQNISDIFIDNLYKIVQDGIPEKVHEQAKLCLIDYMACAMGGAKMMEAECERFFRVVKPQGGIVSVIGFDYKTTLHNAAFIQAMNVHATELDDGHRLGMIHLGASILSALLPMTEVEHLTIDDVLLGVVVGYEAAIRTAMAMQPSHKVRGYHTSGTCGTISSAMAIATAMRLSKDGMKTALSAATASAAGLLELQEDESQMKPFNLAQAAVGGITAAYAAKTGYIGPDDPIGGKRGLLAVMSENPNLEPLQDFDTVPFEIMRIYRKPYAACRHCHPAIEAALWIKESQDIQVSDIASIDVDTYKLAVGGHDHTGIKGVASAKLSTPFSVALALIKDSANLMDFNPETVIDSAILDLTKRVKVHINDELTSWSPQRRAAIVKITTTDGKEFCHEVDYPKGEPENPMTEKEVIGKYRDMAAYAGIDNTNKYIKDILG